MMVLGMETSQSARVSDLTNCSRLSVSFSSNKLLHIGEPGVRLTVPLVYAFSVSFQLPNYSTEIVCPKLKPLEHGKVVVIGGYNPLSKALYSCKKGYKLVGLPLRKCLHNGSWFGSAPTCQLIKY